MIKVENLVKKYGNHVAVDHLSFEVEKGQIYGFLGPNGAGKTTTMNMMTGYLAPTKGTVQICGFDMLTQPEKAKKHIGYLPEIPPLYPDMTVLEYLRFVAELKKVARKERQGQIEEIMQTLGILDVANRLIKNLSKGYKQRVGLAQAIIGYPDVIILDEPMVGLDPKQIHEIRELIRNLSQNHTIILSSHILTEISSLCDHIIIISHGKLAASDSPAGLQGLMKKSVEIEMSVSGTREAAEELLAGIEHIDSYTFEEAEEENSIQIRIVTEGQADIRKELSIRFTSDGMPVLSMKKVEKSLEDIFLQLTDSNEEIEEQEEEADDSDL
ncbi:MAG: ABC transporter ATP-binding protein [Blautia sp.]|nr:ABC transporter ATP-binding protein [Lachnoclostridium sp.]MCM1210927.1 ABC transporter ATP-binding protein [Blautia sp.]